MWNRNEFLSRQGTRRTLVKDESVAHIIGYSILNFIVDQIVFILPLADGEIRNNKSNYDKHFACTSVGLYVLENKGSDFLQTRFAARSDLIGISNIEYVDKEMQRKGCIRPEIAYIRAGFECDLLRER